MRTLAVIPALNEAATVASVVAGVNAIGLEALVVDDGSSDDTSQVAAAAGAAVARLPVNIGVGGAMRTGFAYAVQRGYRRVIHIDADLQHDASAIPDLVAGAEATGAELLIGSRFAAGYRASPARRALMSMLAKLVSRRVGVRLDDVTSGFRVITEPLLSYFAVAYPTEYLGDTVEAILAAHAFGARIAQVPVSMSPRAAGAPTPRLHAAGHLARLLLAMAVRPRRPRSAS